jgi:hypothetical protein
MPTVLRRGRAEKAGRAPVDYEKSIDVVEDWL